MALCVLSYPNLERRDFEWIQSLRAKHEKLAYALVKPHITLVFPTDAMAEDEYLNHVRGVISHTPPVSFAIRCAVMRHSPANDRWNVFLVPDEGYSSIVKLHDRLYTGPLAGELRLDVPFIPHITVASRRAAEICQDLVAEINEEGICIEGSLNTVDIVSYQSHGLTTMEKIDLFAGR